jgi:hypothetical protein
VAPAATHVAEDASAIGRTSEEVVPQRRINGTRGAVPLASVPMVEQATVEEKS